MLRSVMALCICAIPRPFPLRRPTSRARFSHVAGHMRAGKPHPRSTAGGDLEGDGSTNVLLLGAGEQLEQQLSQVWQALPTISRDLVSREFWTAHQAAVDRCAGWSESALDAASALNKPW